jgi:hypothetical protein
MRKFSIKVLNMVVVIEYKYIRIYTVLTAFGLQKSDIQSNSNIVKPFWNTQLLQIKHQKKTKENSK